MRFFVIGDEDTVIGFRFAGVPGTAVSGAEEAASALEKSVERADGVLIIPERVAHLVREQIDAVRFGEALPLIVEIPGRGGPEAETPSLYRLIRDAVGIELGG